VPVKCEKNGSEGSGVGNMAHPPPTAYGSGGRSPFAASGGPSAASGGCGGGAAFPQSPHQRLVGQGGGGADRVYHHHDGGCFSPFNANEGLMCATGGGGAFLQAQQRPAGDDRLHAHQTHSGDRAGFYSAANGGGAVYVAAGGGSFPSIQQQGFGVFGDLRGGGGGNGLQIMQRGVATAGAVGFPIGDYNNNLTMPNNMGMNKFIVMFIYIYC
jgi:hypothetical protein